MGYILSGFISLAGLATSRVKANRDRRWKPWERSNGPKATQGKAKVSQNAYQGGTRAVLRELARLLRQLQTSWEEMSQIYCRVSRGYGSLQCPTRRIRSEQSQPPVLAINAITNRSSRPAAQRENSRQRQEARQRDQRPLRHGGHW